MKFLFHFPFALPDGVTVADVLLDRVPASGTVASTRLANALAALGNACVVLDSRQGAVTTTAGNVSIEATLDAAARFQSEGADAVLVLPPASAMEVLRSIRNARGAIVFWLHNNLAIDVMDHAFAIGLARAVCVSHPAAEVYDAYPWWERVEAIPHSLRGEFPFAPKAPQGARVAFIGAVGESKGFHHLLAAWPHVIARVPDATLDVFGSAALHQPAAALGASGAMTRDFEQRYWRPALASSVRFHGALTRLELIDALRMTRVAVVNPNLTGSTETFCLSAVEAQACGVPVIGAAAGGLLETVADGRSGILIRTQSPHELADTIVKLLQEDVLSEAMSKGAVEHAWRFRSAEVEAKRWMAMARRIAAHEPADRYRSTKGKLLGVTGFGRAKLALKKRLRPHPDLRR